MSSAALVQLMATGASDASIIDPVNGSTFWSTNVKPHTPFSMESVELVFNGVSDFNRTATVDLVRSCDLMHSMHLQVLLPPISLSYATSTGIVGGNAIGFSWARDFGHKMIDNVYITVGSLQIDKHYGPWLAIWAQLTIHESKAFGYGRMVGDSNMSKEPLTQKLFGKTVGTITSPTGAVANTLYPAASDFAANVYATNASGSALSGTVTTGGAGFLTSTMLYVPLQFWFNRVPGLALPLVALQFHQVRLQFTFSNISTLNGYGLANPGTTYTPVLSLPQIAIGSSSPIGITAAGSLTSSQLSGATSIRLFGTNINLGAAERTAFASKQQKYLIEQLQMSSGDSLTSSNQTVQLQLSHPVKFLAWTARPAPGAADADRHDFQLYSSAETTSAFSTPMSTGSSALGCVLGVTGTNHLSNGASNALLAASSATAACGVSPLALVGLKFNSSDRFLARDGSYFNLVQPYDHFTRIPTDAGIHVYSFALDPTRSQPTGSANFSRLDTVSMVLTPRFTGQLSTYPLQFTYYAVNLNTFVVSGGMGGIAWAN